MTAAAQMEHASPFLLVADVRKAAAYYSDVLGFSVPRFWNDPPTFAIASRDSVSVMLRQVGEGETFRPNGALEDCLDAYIRVRDADALHDELKGRGADIVCPPVDQPYMMRELLVRDVDGHVLCFGHDTSSQGAANG